MKQLDKEMQRTDELLYQMLPRVIAERLRSGDPSVTNCEVLQIILHYCITLYYKLHISIA